MRTGSAKRPYGLPIETQMVNARWFQAQRQTFVKHSTTYSVSHRLAVLAGARKGCGGLKRIALTARSFSHGVDCSRLIVSRSPLHAFETVSDVGSAVCIQMQFRLTPTRCYHQRIHSDINPPSRTLRFAALLVAAGWLVAGMIRCDAKRRPHRVTGTEATRKNESASLGIEQHYRSHNTRSAAHTNS
jgi:hypothetical protein